MNNNDIKTAIETLNNAIGCATDSETVKDLELAIKALEIMKKIPSLITKLEKEQTENTYGDLELVGINKGLSKAICTIQNIVKE